MYSQDACLGLQAEKKINAKDTSEAVSFTSSLSKNLWHNKLYCKAQYKGRITLFLKFS